MAQLTSDTSASNLATNISFPSQISWGGLLTTAQNQINLANTYADEMARLAGSLGEAPIIEAEFPPVPDAPVPLTTTVPEFDPIVFNLPGQPGAFTGVLDTSGFDPEPFDDDPPALTIGAAPLPEYGELPTPPTITTEFADPTLELTLPAAPNLLSLNVRPFDGVTIPEFSEEVPELVINAPTVVDPPEETVYTSDLLELLKSELTSRMTGGTGLSSDVENAIWDRMREREAIQKRDALDALDQMEELGYALPPGVWVDARLRLETEMNYNAANASREIAIKQAELAYQNIIDATKEANQLEANLMNYANQVAQRLFDSYRYRTEAGIAVYNARVQAYQAYLAAYRTKIDIYKAQIEGELARVQAYRAEIQAEEAKAQVNSALVDQYRTQVQAALANVDIYKAEIEGIRSKAEIEGLKIRTYGEQVRGYAAGINAYTAQVEGYRAGVQAEVSKQDAYRSKVEAYRAQTEAQTSAIRAKIEEYLGLLRAKELEWEGYKAATEGEAARARAITDSNRNKAIAFEAEVRATSQINEAYTRQWEAAVQQAQTVAQIGVAAAEANARLYTTIQGLAVEASKVGAQVAAQTAAAAYSVVNYSQSFSQALSASDSVSGSVSISQSVNAEV